MLCGIFALALSSVLFISAKHRHPTLAQHVQACNRMGYECVPLYDTLGENAIEYIIDHSEADFVVVAAAKMPNFTAALPKITQKLKGVVYWGSEATSADLDKVAGKGFTCTSFEKFVTDGMKLGEVSDAPLATDPCTIMYTSGTTGDPKGVILTHAAVVTCVNSLKAYLHDSGIDMTPGAQLLPRVLAECATSLRRCAWTRPASSYKLRISSLCLVQHAAVSATVLAAASGKAAFRLPQAWPL